MRSIRELKNLRGKTALVRVDFNVPILNGKVLDDFRIRKALPTIKFLLQKGAKIILITHLGKDGSESLKPIINHFFKISKYPKQNVSFFDNIRKFPGEIKNDKKFAQELAKLGDIYVNEAFSVSHREHASVVSLPRLLSAYAGLQFKAEIKNLSKVMKNPRHPFLYIAGGAKFSTKLPLLKKFLRLADFVFVGGSLANDFLKAKGYEVGKSLVSENVSGIKSIANNKKINLPEDAVIKDEAIIDIGKESVKSLEDLIKRSRLILWNGPLGRYEDGGGYATKKIIKFILKQKGKEIIIGGGDLVSLIPKKFIAPKAQSLKPGLFISTGGGAMLAFLATGTLSGIKALK